MLRKYLFELSFILTMVVSHNAYAASFSIVDPMANDAATGCSILLRGKIQKGDATKLLNLIKKEDIQHEKRTSIEWSNKNLVVCLSSLGGSYLEGFELADLFKKQFITTKIKPNDKCVSACAIAFMGGTIHNGHIINVSRYIHVTSKLGFHAPSLEVSEGEYNKNAVDQAYAIAVKSFGLLTSQAEKFQISDRLINQIATHTNDNFFYISQIKDLLFMDIYLYGYAAPKENRKSRSNLCLNTWTLLTKRYVKPQKLKAYKIDEHTGKKAPKSKLSNKGDVLVYYPFDGSILCDTLFTYKLGGGDINKIVYSEDRNFANISTENLLPDWARLHPNSFITSLKKGNIRDFLTNAHINDYDE